MSVFEAYLTLQMDTWLCTIMVVGVGLGIAAALSALNEKRVLAAVFVILMLLCGAIHTILPSSENLSLLRNLQRYNAASQQVNGQAMFPLARGNTALPPRLQ